ncbi:MAG: hypothetical protein GY858_06400 [Candidatus Omnitrophica bacterium]|nr:hypothetical protein [Candidatus Omnitrophota bacterium]
MYFLKIFLALFFMTTAISGNAQEPSSASILDFEYGKDICVTKKSGHLRSERTFSIKKLPGNNQPIYQINQHGKGDYGKFKQVTWDAVAEVVERGGFLYPNFSTQTIKNEDGTVAIKYEKIYDYRKKRIFYSATNKDGKVIKKKIFPIKGKTVDDLTMGPFLKAVIANRDKKEHLRYYLVSSEPKLYKINVKDLGIETLDHSSGAIEAIKVRLIPDFGILTKVTSALVPPTYFWCTTNSPHEVLRYEGLETGLGSVCVIIDTEKVERDQR